MHNLTFTCIIQYLYSKYKSTKYLQLDYLAEGPQKQSVNVRSAIYALHEAPTYVCRCSVTLPTYIIIICIIHLCMYTPSSMFPHNQVQ